MTLTEVMQKTKDLIADPKHWVCGIWTAKDSEHGPEKYCLEGALAVALGIELYDMNIDKWWETQTPPTEFQLRLLQNTMEYQWMSAELYKIQRIAQSLASFNDSRSGIVDGHAQIMEFMDTIIQHAKEYDNDSTQHPF